MAMSRRLFIGSSVMGAATLATGLTASGPAAAAEACLGGSSGREDAFIKATADALGQIMRTQPNAPGLNDLLDLLDAIYPTTSGSADDRLLQGALYLEAQHFFEMRSAAPTYESLSKGLAVPLDVTRMNPDYFKTLLARTKKQVACDAEYARAVSVAAGQAQALSMPCFSHPWRCIGVIAGFVAGTVLVILYQGQNP